MAEVPREPAILVTRVPRMRLGQSGSGGKNGRKRQKATGELFHGASIEAVPVPIATKKKPPADRRTASK
jgi:hypothetical protein